MTRKVTAASLLTPMFLCLLLLMLLSLLNTVECGGAGKEYGEGNAEKKDKLHEKAAEDANNLSSFFGNGYSDLEYLQKAVKKLNEQKDKLNCDEKNVLMRMGKDKAYCEAWLKLLPALRSWFQFAKAVLTTPDNHHLAIAVRPMIKNRANHGSAQRVSTEVGMMMQQFSAMLDQTLAHDLLSGSPVWENEEICNFVTTLVDVKKKVDVNLLQQILNKEKEVLIDGKTKFKDASLEAQFEQYKKQQQKKQQKKEQEHAAAVEGQSHGSPSRNEKDSAGGGSHHGVHQHQSPSSASAGGDDQQM